MSADESKVLARRFIQIWVRGNLGVVGLMRQLGVISSAGAGYRSGEWISARQTPSGEVLLGRRPST